MRSIARTKSARIFCWLIAASPVVAQQPRPARGALIAVSNELGHTVDLVDARTLKVTRTIHVPQRPRGIEFSPDGKQIFVALSDPQKNVQTSGDGIVSIDVASGRRRAQLNPGTNGGGSTQQAVCQC